MPLKRTRSLTDELINGAGIFRVRQKFSGDEALCNALRCRTRKDAGRERLSLGDCCRDAGRENCEALKPAVLSVQDELSVFLQERSSILHGRVLSPRDESEIAQMYCGF